MGQVLYLLKFCLCVFGKEVKNSFGFPFDGVGVKVHGMGLVFTPEWDEVVVMFAGRMAGLSWDVNGARVGQVAQVYDLPVGCDRCDLCGRIVGTGRHIHRVVVSADGVGTSIEEFLQWFYGS